MRGGVLEGRARGEGGGGREKGTTRQKRVEREEATAAFLLASKRAGEQGSRALELGSPSEPPRVSFDSGAIVLRIKEPERPSTRTSTSRAF